MNLSKFVTFSDNSNTTSALEKRVEVFFDKFGSNVSQDEIAVCIPSVHLRDSNHIDLMSGFKHVFLFVMPDEYELYTAKFPWATCVKRVSTTLCQCRNEIIEYMLKTSYTYFMMVDDEVFWRVYYYPDDIPKTRNANDSAEVCSMLTKNIGLMDKLGADVLYFDRGGFTTSKLEQRLNLKFGSPTFQAFVFRTKIFENPILRYTEDITVPEDDAMNELLQYLNYKYIKAIDIYLGNGPEGEKDYENAEKSNSVIEYVTHKELWERVKKFRAEKMRIGYLQALRNYGYPDLK